MAVDSTTGATMGGSMMADTEVDLEAGSEAHEEEAAEVVREAEGEETDGKFSTWNLTAVVVLARVYPCSFYWLDQSLHLNIKLFSCGCMN